MLAIEPTNFNYILTVKNIVKKSLFIFVLLASSLMMLAVMPFLNNNGAMAQGYYDDSYSIYPTETKNMSVGQTHSKASLYLR
jgi:hypothetical protein